MKGEWIKTSDALPPLTEIVLVKAPLVITSNERYGEREFEAYLDYGGYFMNSDDIGYIEGVTEWKRLNGVKKVRYSAVILNHQKIRIGKVALGGDAEDFQDVTISKVYKAVNMHDELVEALEKAIATANFFYYEAVSENDYCDYNDDLAEIEKAKAVLAKAKGESE